MTPYQKNMMAKIVRGMDSITFRNSHGEDFTIHSDGSMVYLSGSEVEQMVGEDKKIAGKYLPLFNPSFDIWNNEELESLGNALVELMAKVGEK